MSNFKKAKDQKDISKALKLLLRKQSEMSNKYLTGVSGDRILEHVPALRQTPSEKVLKNDNDAHIVLGRDRPGDKESGYGGKGHTQCGSIDLVVGRKGAHEEKSADEADPDFEKDAARIYISQKTDIDDNFGLVKGNVGTPIGKSGIGIKADSLRLAAREGIKIVTGVDSTNSQGARNNERHGIDLIANNNDSGLQPMVLGKNLEEALQNLVDHVDQISGILESFMRAQMQVNTALGTHFHTASSPGGPTTPSADLLPAIVLNLLNTISQQYPSVVNNKLNAAIHKMQYYKPMSDKYINSPNNRTN